MRFGPKFRDAGRNMLEEFELLWVKQEATKGYHILKYAEQDDHIYMLFSGSARMIVPTNEIDRSDIESLKEYLENKRFIVFG